MAATATGQQPVPTENNDQPEKKKGKSDDKCMGNRRIRTILLSGLLFAFAIFALGYIFKLVDAAKDLKDGCVSTDTFPVDCDKHYPGLVHGANFIAAGIIFCLIFLCVQMILLFIPSCNPSTNGRARIPGIGNILGGGLYLFGWIYYISKTKEIVGYDDLSDEGKEQFDAQALGQFGEALLFAGSVILMGIDVLIPAKLLMESEGSRLLFNFLVMTATAVLATTAYLIESKEDSGNEDSIRSAAAAIAAGYIILAIVMILWMILFIVTCDKCTDTCITRVIIGIGIAIGGLVTAVGYWVYAGTGLGEEDGEEVAYFVGYTILVGGLCTVWGLDVLWDDVKNIKK